MRTIAKIAGSARSILGLVVLCALLWLDSSASACDVRFKVTADLPPFFMDLGISCSGPWGRISSCSEVTPDDQEKQFYCADQTAFTLNGGWDCALFLDKDCNLAADPQPKLSFDISDEKPNPVLITVGEDISGNNTITLSDSSTSDSIESSSTLGGGDPTRTDRDTWAVPTELGEIFNIRLEPNRAAGHTGDTAGIIVSSGRGRLIARDSGSLPFELDVVAVGPELEITVVSGDRTPFRGGYRLIVTPSFAENDRVLEPQNDVEF